MDQQMTAPTGRPTAYTQEIADAICEGIADGNSLRSICGGEDMPAKSTVFAWLADDRYEAFRTKYALAREAQADALFDDMIDIADDGRNDWMEKKNAEGEITGWQENGESLRRSDIRIKTRQWMASKLRPKKYGDKLELSGDPDNPVHTVTRIELVAPDHGNSED